MNKIKSLYIQSNKLDTFVVNSAALHISPKGKNVITVPFRYLHHITFVGAPAVSSEQLILCANQKVTITFLDSYGNLLSILYPTPAIKTNDFASLDEPVWPSSLLKSYKNWWHEQNARIKKENFSAFRKEQTIECWINYVGKKQHQKEWHNTKAWIAGFLQAKISQQVLSLIQYDENNNAPSTLIEDIYNLLQPVMYQYWLQHNIKNTVTDTVVAQFFNTHDDWIDLQIKRLLYALSIELKQWENNYASRFIG